jgi:PadR family transcriptional regulator, regulatory protein PadR
VPRTRRPSAQTVAVLLALADDPATWRYGYDLCRHLGLKAGSLYPILMRLAERGLLETSWETETPSGRPPRHLYRLTGPGLAVAADLAPQRDNAKAQPRRVRPQLRTERLRTGRLRTERA